MKLYTEEEIKRTFGFGLSDINFRGYMNAMKPIELPSDEEIEKAANHYSRQGHELEFKEGAKWLKEQILKTK
jgi:hypothetical protein